VEHDWFAIETATSASAGLDYLAENNVSCIVSDYEMPKEAVEFLTAVRERHADHLILYTPKASEAVANQAMSAGVTDYLQKETGTGQCAVLKTAL
jgi:DNA-binding NarL/FixJ family response regulator